MNLTNLTSSDLAKIAKLLKKKESLLQRVAKVDRGLSAFESGAGPAPIRKKRKLSAAARKAIAEGQRRRRAREKAEKAAKSK